MRGWGTNFGRSDKWEVKGKRTWDGEGRVEEEYNSGEEALNERENVLYLGALFRPLFLSSKRSIPALVVPFLALLPPWMTMALVPWHL